MTPEELEALVLHGSTKKLVSALENLEEAERRRLSKTAATLRRKLIHDDPGSQWFPESRLAGQLSRSVLAVLAVGSLTEARRIPLFAIRDEEETAVEILSGRKPEWADTWLREVLDDPNNFFMSWTVVRRLIELGVCGKPEGAGYVRAMVQHMNLATRDAGPSLSRRLLAEPDLLEDEVWRLFEVEHWAFTYNWHDKPERENWGQALVRLSEEGHLDRARLLDASLSAFWITNKTNYLSGYRKFHEALEPTLDELSAREKYYRELLSHKTSSIVGFALKRFDALTKKREVDARELIEALRGVVTLKQKSHASSALRLATRLAGKDATLLPTARELAIESLVHPSADVQDKAVLLLQQESDIVDDDFRTRVAAALDDVSPLVAPRLQSMLNLERATGDEPTEGGESFPPPLEFSSPRDVLASAQRIEPIADVRTLVDAVAHAIEMVDSADELERILDGISRLCHERPSDFERWTSPLLKRLQEENVAETSRGLLAWGVPSMSDLLTTWITGRAHRSPLPPYVFPEGPIRFFDMRVRELTERVASKTTETWAPLLSAPTHTHGWIEPDAIVRRLQDKDVPVLRTDLIQALLRLTPDGRAEALRAAERLSGREGAAIRWALGGDETITKDDRSLATVWLAAGRARAPRGDLTEALAPLGFPESWPDGVTPASYSWDPTRTSVSRRRSYSNWTLMMKAEPELPPSIRGANRGLKPAELLERLREALRMPDPRKMSTAMPLCPTVLFHERGGHWPIMVMQADWLVAGAAMSWPQNLEGFLSRAVDALMLRLDMSASIWDPNYAYLNPLFDPSQPLTEMGILLIWVAFASKDADVRATGKDLLIATIEDGRAHPEPLARVLSRLDSGGWLRLNRISEGLADVARVTPFHELVAANVLERYVATLPTLPPGAHHVLELLHALRSSLGGRIDSDAARILADIKGSSKGAKLARALRALDGPDAALRRANREAWRVRLERGDR